MQENMANQIASSKESGDKNGGDNFVVDRVDCKVELEKEKNQIVVSNIIDNFGFFQFIGK